MSKLTGFLWLLSACAETKHNVCPSNAMMVLNIAYNGFKYYAQMLKAELP